MYHALFLQFISPTNHIACSQVCIEYSSLQVFNIQCCIVFFFLFSHVKYAILLHFGVMILILEFSCRYIYCLFLSPDIIYSICGFCFLFFLCLLILLSFSGCWRFLSPKFCAFELHVQTSWRFVIWVVWMFALTSAFVSICLKSLLTSSWICWRCECLCAGIRYLACLLYFSFHILRSCNVKYDIACMCTYVKH